MLQHPPMLLNTSFIRYPAKSMSVDFRLLGTYRISICVAWGGRHFLKCFAVGRDWAC